MTTAEISLASARGILKNANPWTKSRPPNRSRRARFADRDGRRLVLTNGCFDILHVGHVRYLRQARELGDVLVVALNSDESVRALKGPGRPVNPEADRAEVLLGIRGVEAVVVYDEPRCTRLIRTIRPHVYVEGGVDTPESLDAEERTALGDVGAAIHIVPLVPGKSTSAILERAAGNSARGLTEMRPTSARRTLQLGALGSGRGSNFDAIVEAIKTGRLDAEVKVVISDVSDARILQRAREAGIEAVFVDPGPFKTRLGDAAQTEICDRLRSAGVDLVVLAGSMRRVKEPLLSTFAGRILNIHPSLLPAFPGLRAWQQALDAGVTETGTTVHLVTDDLDAGPILGQERVSVRPGDTAETLSAAFKPSNMNFIRASSQITARDCRGPEHRDGPGVWYKPPDKLPACRVRRPQSDSSCGNLVALRPAADSHCPVFAGPRLH